MGKYISGKPTTSNLKSWASYASKNSFDPNHKDSHKQAKRDLDIDQEVPGSDEPWPARTDGDGGSWYHPSYCSRENSYTGKGGSKRGK